MENNKEEIKKFSKKSCKIFWNQIGTSLKNKKISPCSSGPWCSNNLHEFLFNRGCGRNGCNLIFKWQSNNWSTFSNWMSHGRPLKKEKHCIEPHYKHTYIYFVNRIKQSIPKVRIPNSHRFFFYEKTKNWKT